MVTVDMRQIGSLVGLVGWLWLAVTSPLGAQPAPGVQPPFSFPPVVGAQPELGDLFDLGDLESPVAISATWTGAPGRAGELRITATINQDWHIYSITQKPGGPLASVIQVEPQLDLEVSSDFKANPPPEVHFSDVFPKLPLEEHRKSVTWSAPVKLAAGVDPVRVKLAGKVTVQACNDRDMNCLPKRSYDFQASYVPPRIGEYRHDSSHAVIRGRLEPSVVAPGGKAKLIFTAEPIAPYHIYAWADSVPSSGNRPTIIVLDEGAMFVARRPEVSTPPIEHVDPKTGSMQRYHEEPVTWTLDVTVPETAQSGELTLGGWIGFQTCREDSCDQMRAARFQATLRIDSSTDSSPMPLDFSDAKYAEAAQQLAALAAAGGTSGESDSSLLIILGASLLGGLILNLMPCVLPVIGLKVLSFVEQAGHSRTRVLALNVWYSIGLLSVFIALATLAVTANLGWGEHFQSSTFNIAMCSIVFVMALSFLGVWEIPIPGFIGSGAANDLSQQEGYVGAFFKGVITTLLATPCSGPFLGTVFGYTLGKPPYVTYLIFTFVGLGMASPYLLIGAYPRLIRFLPRPGEWMNTFKEAMGFVLLGTIVFLFMSLKSSLFVATFALLIGLWAGCWLIGRVPLYESKQKIAAAWVQGVTLAAVIGWLSFSWLTPQTNILPWKPYSPQEFVQWTSQGKTVMIDFTADWCLTCKYNLKTVIDTPVIDSIVRENGIVPLLADWTDQSDEIKETLARLGSKSIPVLAIFPAGRPDEPIVLRDLLTQQQVIDALRQAGPSRPATTAQATSPWATH